MCLKVERKADDQLLIRDTSDNWFDVLELQWNGTLRLSHYVTTGERHPKGGMVYGETSCKHYSLDDPQHTDLSNEYEKFIATGADWQIFDTTLYEWRRRFHA